MSQTFRLVYHSLNRIAGTPDQVRAEIDQILTVSRTNNVKVGVTGALMFNSGYFAQVLEGPQGAIEATFERIQQDPRHGEVTLLDLTAVSDPTFANWSMAFVGSSKVEQARFGKLAEISGFDPARISGEELFRRIRDVLIRGDSAAA